MTINLNHEIDIDASPEEVWAVLADTEAYPNWNPFVRELTGELREGGKLEVQIAPPGGRSMTFKPVVFAAEPGRQLRWLGRLLVPGVFDGEHSFSSSRWTADALASCRRSASAASSSGSWASRSERRSSGSSR